MQQAFTTLLGKSVRALARAHGGGSALPGLFVEKIDPHFIQRTLAHIPHGIVLVSGTNGKTTTTKIVVKLLEDQGLRVFTNRTGSNFTRGVAAALLGAVDLRGKLNADIAVLELDEAYAVHFVRIIKPRYALLLNVMRDQLDRFGEIDKTADMLHTIARQTTEGVIVNRDDPRIGSTSFIHDVTATVHSYGVSPSLLSLFPSDDAMHTSEHTAPTPPTASNSSTDDTCLESINGQQVIITFNNTRHTVTLRLKGIYNAQNAVGAVAMTRLILGDTLNQNRMLTSLAQVTPAFGRGENLIVEGDACELILVKNPAGFRLSLKSFLPTGVATMIAINDGYADGRDMSWLWDVNFDTLRNGGVSEVTGVRCYDMALRLYYDTIPVNHVEPNVHLALNHFFANSHGMPKRIYCTYTAMLAIRRDIGKRTKVEAIQ